MNFQVWLSVRIGCDMPIACRFTGSAASVDDAYDAISMCCQSLGFALVGTATAHCERGPDVNFDGWVLREAA